MHQNRRSFLLSLFACLLLAGAARAQEVAFTVAMPRPHTHLFEVEMRVRGFAGGSETDLAMPVWTPGSYKVREFARNVQDLEVTGPDGKPLAWRKTDKSTWRIATAGAKDFTARYKVFANASGNEIANDATLTDRYACWNSAALLMYLPGNLKLPATLRVDTPKDWKIATGLSPVSGQERTFRASDFDALYDAPVLAGRLTERTFDAAGIPHRIAIEGEGNFDADRLAADLKKISEANIALMGDAPFKDYTYLVVLIPGDLFTGLEHANSTLLAFGRYSFDGEGSSSFISLAAHELFHAWNVKAIRPDVLGPFDYSRENYTPLLWVAEGWTEYYGSTGVLRRLAGLQTPEGFLNSLAGYYVEVQTTPGRRAMSVEQASFDAWTKFYIDSANNVNSYIDYYYKGATLASLLDLEIRGRSKGRKSLDDVMRYLYANYAKRGRNYTSQDVQTVCEMMSGSSLDDFFRRYVRGREELPYDTALAYAGLRLETGAGGPQETKIGMNYKYENDRVKVLWVREGDPAYEGGLTAGDEIVAIDGQRITPYNFAARLDDHKPGDVVPVTVFRDDELREFKVTLAGRPKEGYRIVPVEKPTAEQKRIYEAWLGKPFPEPEAKKADG